MVCTVALEECATNFGQTWQQHFQADLIPLLGLA
jgi:hypothetical protein